MVLCPSLCGGWEQIVHSKDLYCFCALKSELCAVDTNGKKIFSDISDVLWAEICSPGRLLYTLKYGKNTNFCVYREIFKKFLSRPRQIPLSVWDKWEGETLLIACWQGGGVNSYGAVFFPKQNYSHASV